MIWTPEMRRGAWAIAVGTLVMVLITYAYLWSQLLGTDVSSWTVVKLAAIIAVVWCAIGATMGFFVVMILKKNAGR